MTVLPLSGDAIAGPLTDGKVNAFGGGCACAGLGREQPARIREKASLRVDCGSIDFGERGWSDFIHHSNVE